MPLPTPGSSKVKVPSGSRTDRLEEMDRVIGNLGREFLVDSADMLGQLGIEITSAIESGRNGADLMAKVRRETHTLKGLGGSFGYPAITVIAHRLEEYLASVEIPTARQLQNILPYLDRMQEIAESGDNPGEEALSRIVRSLPAKGSAMDDCEAACDAEVLLVASSRVLGRAVEGELKNRGYRVVTVSSAMELFETAIRTPPDLIIASAVMDEISGIELARALRAIRQTEEVPFILLTSFERDHPELRRLPDDVALIHHDRALDAELDYAIERIGWPKG